MKIAVQAISRGEGDRAHTQSVSMLQRCPAARKGLLPLRRPGSWGLRGNSLRPPRKLAHALVSDPATR